MGVGWDGMEFSLIGRQLGLRGIMYPYPYNTISNGLPITCCQLVIWELKIEPLYPVEIVNSFGLGLLHEENT